MFKLLGFLGALIVSVAGQPSASQNAALRIVVVEGEDAVNIIQQKTAVAPVIEVRDRNNLPVAGATVTFTVGGQGASFGGLSTLTVTTNAAGQAAAVGLTPTAAGAVQINAAAVFQGQTAVATITQTNVLTAAQAASTAGATASGGAGGTGGATGGGAAAGGGGGLSTTTLVVAGAAVGGGALAATQLVGGDGGTREFAATFSGDMALQFSGCLRIERRTGLLTIELDSPDDAPARGTARIEDGVVTIVSVTGSTCVPGLGPQPGQTQRLGLPGGGVSVSGSSGSITFSATETVRGADGGTSTSTYSFNGAKNGDTIVGTLVQTFTVDNAIPVPVSGTITSNLTLTPH